MKYLITMTLLSLFLSGSAAGCTGDRSSTISNANFTDNSGYTENTTGNKMKIKIGSNTFNATLFDNETAAAFKVMLPLTIEMDELNGNEKKYDFSKSLPTNSTSPKTINSGDLMIWGNNTLVLFYKTFSTQYSYTKLGRIDDPAGLEKAVGTSGASITFELE